ncbi:response regulator transcription factor [Kribbella shirazensis]|uniref:DNA-binding NarL/FixJ family response regulator n=1 Tax=Kribbella shirazensis TaxID=1105143 RepID=A0A7X5VF33_9ACTN|nr:DNA-binding NarL/FixJ family response regulator [Kribbella shirazensis]
MAIKVFLLDDHEIVRLGLRRLLEAEPDIEVVGDGATAAEGIARIPAVRPDVALLDVRLPDGNGVTVCREIRSAMEDPPACLMLTSFSDDEALFAAIMAGRRATCSSESTGAIWWLRYGGSRSASPCSTRR